MTTFLSIAGLLALFIFALGMLLGHSLTEQAFDQRSRRQAKTQRWINQQRDELAARQEADALLRGYPPTHHQSPRSRPTPPVIND
jgi:CHASE3 domain sensor protein